MALAKTNKKNNWQALYQKYGLIFSVLKWLFITAIALIVLFLISSPLRGKAAKKFIEKGDQFLSQMQYLSAELEYTKALSIYPGNAEAKDRLDLADKASANITELKKFFELDNFSELKSRYEQANAVPKDESEAVKLCRKLIEEKEYQLSILAAKTAVDMDHEYRDGWLYLSIANLKTAQFVELKPEVKDVYLNNAAEAANKVLAIDPENKTAQAIKSSVGIL